MFDRSHERRSPITETVTRWVSPARIEAPEPAAWLPILAALDAQARADQLSGPLVDLPAVHLDPTPPDAVPVDEPTLQPATRDEADIAGTPPGVTTAVRSHHHWWHTLVLVVALAVVAAGLPYFLRSPVQRHVTVIVDGVGATQITRAESVAALLAAAGIELRRGDRVEPPLGSGLGRVRTVSVTRAFPVTVVVDGVSRRVRTPVRTVAELRDELDLPAEMVAIDPPARLRRGSTIAFRTTHEVRVVNDGAADAFTSTGLTVADVLAERGIAYDEFDLIEPALDTRVTAGLLITIMQTTTNQVTEDVVVPYAVEERPDPALDRGKRQTIQPGINGVDRTTFRLVMLGDEIHDKQPLASARTQDPQPEIVSVGTKEIPPGAKQSGRATWYATLYQPGTCAHLYLPFGTMVRVTNTSTGASAVCRVADRGPEAWTNNIIDLSPDVFEQLAPLSAGRIAVGLSHN